MRAAARHAIVCCCLFSLSPPAIAIPPLVSGDVPTAPKGVCELFVGHVLRDDGSVTTQSVPFSELVYGATERQELTIEIPVVLHDAQGDTSVGLGDVVVGTKLRLAGRPAADSGLSASIEVKLPTGDEGRGLGSGATDFDVRLRWGLQIASDILYLNLGHTWVGEPSGEDLDNTWLYSAAWDHPMRDRIRLLAELYGKTSDGPGASSRLAASAGFKWKILQRQQLHFSIGASLRHDAAGGPRLRVYTGWRRDF